MPTINILFGFDEPEYEHAVENALREQGYTVESTVKLSKSSIRDFLLANPKYDTAILLEVVSKVNKFTADELAIMTDERDINIIPVVNANLKGTEYMQTLYSAGITSAVFSSKKGATVQDITELILHKRTRREAREYYGISDKPIELGFLGNDTFTEYYGHLSSEQYGNSLLERFINVCTHMSQKQIADFIRRMPAETVDELKLYEEFHMIVALLKEVGIDLRIKRPRKVQIGLVTPDQINLLPDQFGIIKNDSSRAVSEEKNDSDVSENENVFANIKSDSNVKGMSFADLIGSSGLSPEADDGVDDMGDDKETIHSDINPDGIVISSEDNEEPSDEGQTDTEEIADFTLGIDEKKGKRSRRKSGGSKKEARKKEKKDKKIKNETGPAEDRPQVKERNSKKIILVCSIILAFVFIFLGLYFSGVFDVLKIALLNA